MRCFAIIFVALACVVAVGSTGAPVLATTPGANGRIVFRSDRDTAEGELYSTVRSSDVRNYWQRAVGR